MHNTNRVPLRQLAIFDAEYPSEAAVAPTATHLANWSPDNKLQTVVCATVPHVRCVVRARTRTTHARSRETRARSFLLSLPSSTFAFSFLLFPYIDLSPLVFLLSLSRFPFPFSIVDIRTARSNITIRSQTNSLAMPERLPFTGRTVVSPVWPDLDCTWGAVMVGTHQTIRTDPRTSNEAVSCFTGVEKCSNCTTSRLSNGIGKDRDIELFIDNNGSPSFYKFSLRAKIEIIISIFFPYFIIKIYTIILIAFQIKFVIFC